MSEWRTEFQYLLDRKILNSAELGYLFGLIKSIIDRETVDLQTQFARYVKSKDELLVALKEMDAVKSATGSIEAFADSFYELKGMISKILIKEKNNIMRCPTCGANRLMSSPGYKPVNFCHVCGYKYLEKGE